SPHTTLYPLSLHDALPISQVNCVALADIDQNVLDRRAADVEKLRGKKPKLYKDYRKMLEDKDIDMVIVGTPDHWHCLNLVGSLRSEEHTSELQSRENLVCR